MPTTVVPSAASSSAAAAAAAAAVVVAAAGVLATARVVLVAGLLLAALDATMGPPGGSFHVLARPAQAFVPPAGSQPRRTKDSGIVDLPDPSFRGASPSSKPSPPPLAWPPLPPPQAAASDSFRRRLRTFQEPPTNAAGSAAATWPTSSGGSASDAAPAVMDASPNASTPPLWARNILRPRTNGGGTTFSDEAGDGGRRVLRLWQHGSLPSGRDEASHGGSTEITSVEDFEVYWYGDRGENATVAAEEAAGRRRRKRDFPSLLRGLSVRGDTQVVCSGDRTDVVHPVAQLLHDRRRRRRALEQRSPSDGASPPPLPGAESDANPATASSSSKNNSPGGYGGAVDKFSVHGDGSKVALVIEGGGMRGCVSAGMVCAIDYLGLRDCVDVVYGASAGAVVAAYFVSGQLPWFGPEVYYDQLTAAGTGFIDLKRLLRALGFGLADPRLLRDVLTRPGNGKPLLNLRYLTDDVMQGSKPLDWEAFRKRQNCQPLKVVATGLRSHRPYVLDQEGGHFDTLQDFCNSLHASCLLPGIAGPLMNVLRRRRPPNDGRDELEQLLTMHHDGGNDQGNDNAGPATVKEDKQKKPTFVLQNGLTDPDYEPLGDAMLSSPIPYDVAHADGATHVVVIRSSPDGTNLMAGTAAKSVWESLIFRRFFLRKNRLPGMYRRLQRDQEHQRIYASAILELNRRSKVEQRDRRHDRHPSDRPAPPHTMTIALEPGTEEVSHLETSREAIFEGVRNGFARAYDALVDEPTLRGRGYAVAREYFPDEILDYDPESIVSPRQGKEEGGGSNPKDGHGQNSLQSSFERYLQTNDVLPKAWNGNLDGWRRQQSRALERQ